MWQPHLPSRWRCSVEIDHTNETGTQHIRCFKFRSHIRSKKWARRCHEAYAWFPPPATFQGGTVTWSPG